MDLDGMVKLYQPLHNTKGEYLGVIPVDKIVCAVPLVPNYEHEVDTIPASAITRKDMCYPDGECDRPSDKGSGNKTFYLNTFAAQYSDTDGLTKFAYM